MHQLLSRLSQSLLLGKNGFPQKLSACFLCLAKAHFIDFFSRYLCFIYFDHLSTSSMMKLMVFWFVVAIGLTNGGVEGANWGEVGGNPTHSGEWEGAGPWKGCTIQEWTVVPLTSNTNPVLATTATGGESVYFGQWAAETTFFSYGIGATEATSQWNVSHAEIGVVAGSTPLLDTVKERVYVITDSLGFGLFCFDSNSGKPMWPQTFLPTADSTCAPTFGGPDGSLLFVGDWMANLYAVHADSGQLAWQFNDPTPPNASGSVMPYNFNSAPVSHPDGSVLYAASLHCLYAFNSTTGAVMWNTTTNTLIQMTQPSVQLIFDVANNAIFLSGISDSLTVVETPLGIRKAWDRAVFSIDAATGTIRWHQLMKGEAASGEALALSSRLGLVFFATEGISSQKTNQHYLYAAYALNGTSLWHVSLPAPAISVVVDSANTLYITSGRVLSAYDALDGTLLWTWTHNSTFENLLAFTPSGSLWVSDGVSQFAIGPSSTPCVNGQ